MGKDGAEGNKEDSAAQLSKTVLSEHVQNRTINSEHDQNATDITRQSRANERTNPLSFRQRLTVNEWLTFFLSVISLIISYLTYRAASDTSALTTAVTNLSTLAKNTGTEATELHNQIPQIKREADAAQTNAAAFMTSQRAQVIIGKVSITFKRVSGGYKINFGWTAIDYGPTPGFILKVPFAHIINGYPPDMTPVFPVANTNHRIYIAPGAPVDFPLNFATPLPVSKSVVDAIRKNKTPVFVFGTVQYIDVYNIRHESGFCYEFGFVKGKQHIRAWPDARYWFYN